MSKLLGILKDGEFHSYADLERRANTNWKTVRDHCENLVFFEAAIVSKDNKIKITKFGLGLIEKI